jgi:transaldolase
MPIPTLKAFLDHGDTSDRLGSHTSEATAVISQLHQLGINLSELENQLEKEGVVKFVEPFEKLLSSLRERIQIYDSFLSHTSKDQSRS